LVNILILRLCNYDKSPDHAESAGKFTLTKNMEEVTKVIVNHFLNRSVAFNQLSAWFFFVFVY
jgi:hypothetical protein